MVDKVQTQSFVEIKTRAFAEMYNVRSYFSGK